MIARRPLGATGPSDSALGLGGAPIGFVPQADPDAFVARFAAFSAPHPPDPGAPG